MLVYLVCTWLARAPFYGCCFILHRASAVGSLHLNTISSRRQAIIHLICPSAVSAQHRGSINWPIQRRRTPCQLNGQTDRHAPEPQDA